MFHIPRQVYLDHNATTPVAKEVAEEMSRILRGRWGNPSSLHTRGRDARGIVETARDTVAGILGCNSSEIYFTSGGTEGNNTVIRGVFEAAGRRGHIITTAIEHDSVLGACQQVQLAGGDVTYLPAGRDGLVKAVDVKAAIRPDTILVSVMHANNETGALQPVEDIGKIARDAGIPFHTDAVQSFGKIGVNVDDIGCDYLTLSAHKINGPKGAGAIFVRDGAKLIPLISGGDQERGLRTGTEGVHQIAGLARAALLAAERREGDFARLARLREYFLEGLRSLVPDIIVNDAPAGSQLPGTINLTFPGRENIRILAGLDCYEVCVSIGSACTADRVEPSHVLIGMGLSEAEALSSIRMSMGRTTAEADMRYVLKVLGKVLAHDPAGFAYMDPQQLTAERIESPDTFLVDLRFPYERMLKEGIPGAKEWSHIYFERYFKQIPWDREVVLMCGTGIFSFQAGYRLANAGHPRVRVVYGGYAAWESIYPDAVSRLKR
ncbi:MAG: aminotransferase class V-fold PLP-dependent enzyme [Nitrospirae bacterium]|nr:aminotransferase class V-fold PLP-dependent enzyme [Nitrospirota bacterium]MBI5696139.1 aminotransferase class V-fold PLP-dependent enzyme [Nitrospirota bacterium]